MSDMEILGSLAVVAVSCLALFLYGRDDEAASPDESYLWYGTREVVRGQVPLRDFRSYEPGRYWFAAPFEMVKPGIRTTRFSATLFLAGGLAAFSITLRSYGHSIAAVCFLCATTCIWSTIPSKRFDQGVLLWIAAAASWCIGSPETTTFLMAGIVVGLAAVFGANHALYGVACLGLATLLSVRQPTVEFGRSLGWLVIGAIVGSLPLWGAAIAIRGFGRPLVQRRIFDLLRRGSTNLPLTYPHPLRPGLSTRLGPRWLRLKALLFTVLPASAAVVAVIAVVLGSEWTTSHPALVGASLTALVAWHHVVSRADLPHLSTVIPLFVAAASAVGGLRWWALVSVAVLWACASAVVSVPRHRREQRRRNPDSFVQPDIDIAHGLWFNRAHVPLLEQAESLARGTPSSKYWVAIPTLLWLLPLADRRSAVYDTFCVYPADEAMQTRMISEVEAADPAAVFVATTALDGRDDLRFMNTHPRVWDYVNTHFEVLDPSALDQSGSVAIFINAGD